MTELEKEYSELLERAGVENKPKLLDVKNPVTGKLRSQLMNHFKNAMRFFKQLPPEAQKGEIAQFKAEMNLT